MLQPAYILWLQIFFSDTILKIFLLLKDFSFNDSSINQKNEYTLNS